MIKTIYKNFVCLYNHDLVSTNGIFIIRTENLEILGSELLEQDFNSSGNVYGKVNFKVIPGK